jgi:hypothetical protein
MSLDVRTRIDGEGPSLEPARFFAEDLPAALARTQTLRLPGLGRLQLRPMVVVVDDDAWTLAAADGDVAVRAGAAAPDALRWLLTRDELAALATDETTPIGLYAGGSLRLPVTDLPVLLDWWLVLRSALDERPLHRPGAVTFVDRSGAPLDLKRTFRPDDDRAEMSHFLREAGFLHIAGVFGEDEMAEIAADMDRAAPSYRDGDGRSWWATTGGGERRLVRMQGFDERSEATARLIRDERLLGLGHLSGAGHVHTGLEANRIEALQKPIGVVAGISDLPWHKDCSLGRHSFDCCSLTVGISVTGADAQSGQLRVVAGSHRALLWPARLVPGHHDLPEIDLPTRTGDVTIHTSCTLHMSEAPTLRERRVMYTSFRLPDRSPETTRAARARLREVREKAPVTVSQPPSEVLR